MATLPSGTVTFFFTDIEGSTRRWERQQERMRVALARHDEILRTTITTHGGLVFKTVGDAFYAVFTTAPAALNAAIAVQHTLRAEDWGEIDPIRVRVSLHTGTVEAQNGDYFGRPLNRVARILSAGHGGQILLSVVTEQLVRDQLPPGVTLRDMGWGRLKDLLEPEHIYQVVAPDLPADFPPLKTLDARVTNLPALGTPLIGRDKDVAAALALLNDANVRVLTLTGPGGTGKTRLGLQIAAEALDFYPDGVFFVPLDDVRDPGLIPVAIARAIGLAETGSKSLREALMEQLRGRTMLLLLDNFEQVTTGAAFVSEMMMETSTLNILVTSRAALRIYGEREYPVAPLKLPETRRLPSVEQLMQYDAIRLFTARAQAVRSDFVLTPANAATVVQICRQLDGLPLAIELAVARLKLLSPQDLAARLDNRLQTLTRGSLDLPARQQTLRAAIGWSYDILPAEEQTLFARMAIFAGGGTLDACEAICTIAGDPPLDIADVLASLVDKSLVLAKTQSNGEARFAMLNTIREYALERLKQRPEQTAIAAAHARYYRRLVEVAEPELAGTGQAAWLARLTEEMENVRVALEWAVAAGNAESAVRLCGAFWRFWNIRGDLSEGRRWLETSLALPGPVPPLARAKALDGLGTILQRQRQYATAQSTFEEGLVIRQVEGDLEAASHSLSNLGSLAREQGDYVMARERYEDCLAIRREIKDRPGTARTLINLGIVAQRQGDFATARARYEEGLTIGRSLGSTQLVAHALSNLGVIAQQQHDNPAARAFYEQSLTIARHAADQNAIATALNNLGAVARDGGDLAASRRYYEESVAARRALGDTRALAFALNNLGTVVHQQSAYEDAHASFTESLGIWRDLQQQQGTIIALTNLGALARDREDYAAARAAYTESMTLSRDAGDTRGMLDALEGFAAIIAARGDRLRAAQLWAAAESARTVLRAPSPPADAERRAREIAAAREATDAATWERAHEEGTKLSLDHAIADATLMASITPV